MNAHREPAPFHPHRRQFLRGLGVAIALPFLESLPGVGSLRDAAAWGAPAPVDPDAPLAPRIAFVFVPNGTHYADWQPTGTGFDYQLSKTLAPIERHRQQLTVLSGLAHGNARALGDGPGDHARSSACFLTGAHPVKNGDIEAGVSIDQVLAAGSMGDGAPFPSLELGTDPGLQAGRCDSGYSCAYSSNIAWRTPNAPMAKEVNPRLLFERLFGIDSRIKSPAERKARRRSRRSILDFARSDASKVRAQLGRGDKQKLDEYFDGIRAIERRLDLADAATTDPQAVSGMEAPSGVPNDFREHLRLMYDLIVVAFKLDLTRVVSFMLANEGSNRRFPFIEVREGHHHLSHHRGDEKKIADIRKIDRFYVEEFGRFLDTMAATPDGPDGRTLLDTSLILYGGAISDGNRHNHHDLPILLAGRGRGRVTPGRHVEFPKHTPLCNLFASMKGWTGAGSPSFGDSTGPLGMLQLDRARF
ncbi:MAG: DUF1552 domain-containing protein [Planctomycetota bacterium]